MRKEEKRARGYFPRYKFVFFKTEKQCRSVGITQDEEVTEELFRSLPCLWVTSPYMNFTPRLEEALRICGAVHILTAHPSVPPLLNNSQANGFFTAKDISRFIPAGYAALEEKFYHRFVETHPQATLQEYKRDGWSFHGKGMWGSTDGTTIDLTLLGSANFGIYDTIVI